MSKDIPNLPDITCGPLTLDEIKYHFLFNPNPVISFHSIDRQETESSPELSDSFKEELDRAKNSKNFHQENIQNNMTSDEEIFEDASEEIFGSESDDGGCAAIEKTMLDIDDTQCMRKWKIRDSLLLAQERPSINVTKSRPHYILNKDFAVSPNSSGNTSHAFGSTFQYIRNVTKSVRTSLHATMEESNGHTNDLKSPFKENKIPQLTVNPPKQGLKTPVKNFSKQDKFAHVKSPVAQYIHSTPFSPQVINVNMETFSPRINFRKSNALEVAYAVEYVQSLPMRKLVKSTNVVEIVKLRMNIHVRVHQVVAPKLCDEFLNNTFNEDKDEVIESSLEENQNQSSDETFDEYDGVADLLNNNHSIESGFAEDVIGIKELFE